ncbi:polysaccharide ABC transporter ATP-binding protein [Isoptericola sp. NEAU-Y5]|uniref:Polysaccharide ABC transporter ATP-binding protein n=1 Tax=Isoptericola luteus TaxID=2879484 RepID=A0ABS7ZCW6_9MICO|nr:polysaccharide ABC transporter ATP-binding protein [Isoptericola sp. NEAU-Y5]MCA5892885.1 polysaccharide ABC transporter ATP-binding protein [Isoptericola sp. NEAU-Y5]
MNGAIRVSGLGKTYRIARSGQHVNRATEAVLQRLRHPLQRTEYEEFEALRDIDLQIGWGEAVGIVGRNGAGKSTLLKVLTRITAPSTGRIELGGRVGSLLEVGTGFHPELTGRENVYLNGTLLGMRRKEIQRRFDEIVDFAGVDRFLDTPVKRYSSGMYVRLAFSVAAHLETEILAIDEVLAVGDAEFQAKSIAKMREAARSGRTVLYVSHQAQTVSALCDSALFLDRGTVTFQGPVEDALAEYRRTFSSFQASQQDPSRRSGTGELRFTRAQITEETMDPTADKVVEFDVDANDEVVGSYFVSCHVNDADGNVVVQCDSRLVGMWLDPSTPQSAALRIKDLWLKPGRYTYDLYLCKAGILDAWEGAGAFEVLPKAPYPAVTSDEALTHGQVLADFEYERR